MRYRRNGSVFRPTYQLRYYDSLDYREKMKHLRSKHMNIKNMYRYKYDDLDSASGCIGDSDDDQVFDIRSCRSITSLSQGAASRERLNKSRKKAISKGRMVGNKGRFG